MNITRIILCGALLSGVHLSQAQTTTASAKEHPIETELNNCLSQKPSTFGVIECELERYRKWSEELDRIYDQLMLKLDDNSKSLLKEQQIAWTKYRDLQFEFNEKFYGARGGVWMSVVAANKGDVIKRRVLELEAYLNMLDKQ